MGGSAPAVHHPEGKHLMQIQPRYIKGIGSGMEHSKRGTEKGSYPDCNFMGLHSEAIRRIQTIGS